MPDKYSAGELSLLRQQLKRGNREARLVVQARGITLHPRIAQMKRVDSTRVHNNKHGFRGVEWEQARSKFRARIEPANGQRGRWLGRYETAREAALAYDAAAREVYGDEAFLNFPRAGEKQVMASPRAEGTCPKGHDLKEHGYVRKDGRGINCRKCNSEATLRSYRKKRAAHSHGQ